MARLVGQTEPALHVSSVHIAPSAQQLTTLPSRFEPRWVIPSPIAANLDGFFVSSGFRAELAAELRRRLRSVENHAVRVIVPDRELLTRFSPTERALWWELLQLHQANESHRWPLSLSRSVLAALAAEPRWAGAVSRLRLHGVAHGDQLVFADLFALEDTFASPADRLDFYRVALGQPAAVLKLRRQTDRPLDAAAQASWWQVNGRYRAIEPLLNAIAAIPNAPRLDLAHLLPRLPRSLLNTFPPHLADADDSGIDSGLLASEFFALTPGVDPSSPGGLKAWLERECVPVTDSPQYGDILTFGDLDRSAWPYAAIYVAQDYIFARRPTAFGAWQFLQISDVGRLNPRFAHITPRLFRPRSALSGPDDPAFIPGRMPAAWRKQLRLEPVPPGPWGRLWYYEVLLAPSSNTLEQLPAPDPKPEWTFADITLLEIRRAIAEVEMPADVRAQLTTLFRDAATDDANRITVHPTLDLVLAVPPEFRRRVFPKLVGGESITDYAQHIPFPLGFTIDEWLEAGSLPESVRQAILRLAYPVGDRVMLSDFGALYALLPSRAEQLSAHRAALRVPAVVLLMEKPRPEEVPAIADYWRRGRAKDIRGLLESFARAGDDLRFLDIIHLLSPIEREFLNAYFTPEGPALTPSCFWTAFNFGEEKPDNRYLVLPGTWSQHEAMAWQDLNRDFDRLSAPGRVGDIIGYRRQDAPEITHVCVFIAPGIVLTKNGATFSKPWHLAKLSDIDELYLTSPGMERVYFRRRPAP